MSGVRTPLGPRPRRHGLVALALAGSLALAGCSGGSTPKAGKASPTPSPSGQSTAAGAVLSGQWPLTGLPASGPVPKHPVMIVKIDNTEASRPQIGLKKADMVSEELVEGGSTRLAVFYYSQVPKLVGPVRSFRATDIGIVKPEKAALVASGGAPPTVRRMAAAHIKTYTEGAPGFFRDNSRPAPYNLFSHLQVLSHHLKSRGRPANYLPWGSPRDFPSGSPAKGLAAVFSGGHTTTWKYTGGHYRNLDTNAAKGDQFHADTVLVLRVHEGDAGYLDPAGNPVPEAVFTGKGDAMVFHGGRVVRGTWTKHGLDATVRLETTSGAKLALPPGHVWIELVPSNGGSVRITK
jgi:hypothetical protein